MTLFRSLFHAAIYLVITTLPSASFAADSIYDYERIVVSTPKVEKILGAPPGWGDHPDFFLEKKNAFYCYLEEDPQRTADLMATAMDNGWDFRTDENVELEESACFEPFLKVAKRPQYQEDKFDLYSTEYDYAEIHSYVARYTASCVWEKDPARYRAELDGVENPKGIWPYHREKYQVETYAENGMACFPGFSMLEERESGFYYNFIQQMLVRQELDD